ncbi:MAG: alpha-L-fucosidase [Clostridia bacterium]|nr:alpha-L-fucosidase [Clostridia bacterium]
MWIDGNYRRNLLDMHIADWDESFLSQLDPEEYVSCLKEAGVQAAMVKARSHTGLNYWPGPNGRMHRGLKGKDFVGEMVRLCHREGIAVVLYYSQIFDNLAYEEHPEWRLVTPEGIHFRDFRGKDCFRNGRYGICCPNQPGYRAYVRDALQDLAARYEAEGFFLDMAFWPDICCCDACADRWRKESGLGIPQTVDWNSPEFRLFTDARQRWLREFAEASTRAVREIRPDVTVEHQYSMISQPWLWGVTEKQAMASDFCSGDYYGGFLQQSFINKYYRNVSRHLPFCYHTGRCDPELAFHTTTKSGEQLVLHAATALLHGGAFLLVDAINPDGSIQPEIYRKLMKRVYDQTRPFEPFVNGNLLTEAGIWFASEAKFDPRESGTPAADVSRGSSVYADAPLGMTRILRDAHIPFDILGSGNLHSYSGRLIVIPHVAAVTDEEMDALETYVSRGGSLYVSGPVSHPRLAKLLGVETTGQTEETFTYLAPANYPEWMEDFSSGAPLTWAGRQWTGRVISEDTEVLARCVLPWTMPGSEHFAAIHSNPPGKETGIPAMTLRRVSGSLLLWVSAPLEMNQPYLSRKFVEGLVRRLIRKEIPETDAPRFVELLRWEKEGKHYLALINEQEESPVAPARGIHLTVPGFRSASLLPGNLPLRTEPDESGVRIELPELELFAVMELIP